MHLVSNSKMFFTGSRSGLHEVGDFLDQTNFCTASISDPCPFTVRATSSRYSIHGWWAEKIVWISDATAETRGIVAEARCSLHKITYHDAASNYMSDSHGSHAYFQGACNMSCSIWTLTTFYISHSRLVSFFSPISSLYYHRVAMASSRRMLPPLLLLLFLLMTSGSFSSQDFKFTYCTNIPDNI